MDVDRAQGSPPPVWVSSLAPPPEIPVAPPDDVPPRQTKADQVTRTPPRVSAAEPTPSPTGGVPSHFDGSTDIVPAPEADASPQPPSAHVGRQARFPAGALVGGMLLAVVVVFGYREFTHQGRPSDLAQSSHGQTPTGEARANSVPGVRNLRADLGRGALPKARTALLASIEGLEAPALIQMMLAASVANEESDLLVLVERIELLPKPARGDRKAARALNQAGLDQLANGSLESAVDAFARAASLDSADAEIADNLAYASMKVQDYQKSFSASISALALSPSRSSAWATLGIALAEIEGESAAVAAFSNAYRFSRDVEKTTSYLDKLSAEHASAKVQEAARKARRWVGPTY